MLKNMTEPIQMDVKLPNSLFNSQSSITAETNCSNPLSASNFKESHVPGTTSTPCPFQGVYLPHQIVINLERVSLEFGPQDEINQETDTIPEASPTSFDDIFLPDQIVIKLERTKFGIEIDRDHNVMPPPEIPMKIETDHDAMPPLAILIKIEKIEVGRLVKFQAKESREVTVVSNEGHHLLKEEIPINCQASDSVSDSMVLEEPILSRPQSDDNRYRCPICPQIRSNATDLDTHMAKTHKMSKYIEPPLPGLFNNQNLNGCGPSAASTSMSSDNSGTLHTALTNDTNQSIDTKVSNTFQSNTGSSSIMSPRASTNIDCHNNQPPSQSLALPTLALQCPFCNVWTPNIVEHLLTHPQNETKFAPCPFCSNPLAWFANAFDLRAHLTQAHITELEFQLARSSISASSSSTCALAKVPKVEPGVRTESGEPITCNTQSHSTSAGAMNQTVDEVFDRFKSSTPSANSNKMMQCTICKQFPTNMMLHRFSHKQTKQRSLPCTICPQTWFSKKDTLSAHMHRVHNQPLPPELLMTQKRQCNVCKQFVSSTSSWHMKQHIKTADRCLPCPICPQTWFTAKHILSEHINRIHKFNQINRKVDDTQVNLGMPLNMHGHLRKYTGAVCGICGMRVSDMKMHVLRHTQSHRRHIPCPICPQTWFSNNLNLNTHLSKTHKDKTMSTHSEMISIQTIHSKHQVIDGTLRTSSALSKSKCTICGMWFRHMAAHMVLHTQTATNSLPCPICPQTWFSHENHLSTHLKLRHSDSQPPTVTRSSNAANSSSTRSPANVPKVESGVSTESHVPTITNDQCQSTSAGSFDQTIDEVLGRFKSSTPSTNANKIMQCTICKQFPPNMMLHLFSHKQTKQRSLPCTICPQTWFSKKSTLLVHMHRVHNQPLPAPLFMPQKRQCNVCKQFVSSTYRLHMNQHIKTVDRCLPCPICPQTWFAAKHALLGHMNRIHKFNQIDRKVADTHANLGLPPNMHEQPRRYNRGVCGICGMRVSDIKMHMLRHTQSDACPLPCPICPQTWFSNNLSLKRHMRQIHATMSTHSERDAAHRLPTNHIMTPIRSKCAVCGLPPTDACKNHPVVNPANQMMSIKTISSKDQVIKCTICGMWCRQMTAHMVLHTRTATNSLPCPICPQTWFSHENHLSTHLKRRHSDSQPPTADTAKKQDYKSECTICCCSYSNHEAHMQRHTKTEDRSQPCPICPQTWFANGRFLKNHIAAFHGNAQPQTSTTATATNQSDDSLPLDPSQINMSKSD